VPIVSIENLPYWFSADDLRDLVAPHGTILSVAVSPAAAQLAPVTGVVILATREDAQRTVEALNGAECLGYMLQAEMRS
jgi:RNA recognition motif-containing protein